MSLQNRGLQTPKPQTLKPQDVLVACRLALPGGYDLFQKQVAAALGLAPSTVFASLQNLRRARLVAGAGTTATAARAKLLSFLVHGAPVVFLPVKTEMVRGIATGIFSPYFRDRFAEGKGVPLVWPYSRGREVGEGLVPLYPSLPLACSRDPALYQLMAAVDVLRVGRAREKDAASGYIEELFAGDEAGKGGGAREINEDDEGDEGEDGEDGDEDEVKSEEAA